MKLVQYLMGATIACSLLAASATAACTKTVRWYDDAPHSYRADNGEIRGFDVELSREVLRRIGCQAHYVEMPWARALVELESGRLDILPGSYRSPERERIAYFSIPALQSPNLLYLSRAAAAKYKLGKLEDLLATDLRLGVQLGVSYGDSFDSMKSDPRFRRQVSTVTLRRNAWKMMEMGRIDGMIADQATAELELKELGLAGKVQSSGIVVSTKTAMFAFSKRTITPAFVATFNAALQSMIDDGAYQLLHKRYLTCEPKIRLIGCK